MSLLGRLEKTQKNTFTSKGISSGLSAGASSGASGGLAAKISTKPAAAKPKEDPVELIKKKVHEKVIQDVELTEIAISTDLSDQEKRAALEGPIFEMVIAVSSEDHITLPRQEFQRIVDDLINEIVGLGPLEPLLRDDAVTEVMVNGPNQIYVEKAGKLTLTDVKFKDDDHVMRIIERIVSPIGRRVDESVPYCDARLKDGSRVNIIIPPLSLIGPVITIRKFFKKPLSIEDLIRFGSLTKKMGQFLEAAVKAHFNIVVSGGTGSGKTTLLNVLSSFIPPGERIITCEDAAEVQLQQPHVISLESRPPNVEGKGAVPIRILIKNCLRMRPERIIVGECRGGEALDMLQAMNTGHDGSLTTLHANNPREAISRIETMCMMAGMELPQRAIREQIASAVQLIVQASRLSDGSRRVEYITECIGMEGDVVVLQDIYLYKRMGKDERGKIIGKHTPTGIKPKYYEKFEAEGIKVPPDVFTPDSE